MSFSVSVSTSGGDEIIAALSKLKVTPKLLGEIGQELANSTRSRIRNQTDVNGNPFKASWRAKVQNGKTLIDTGGLVNSITSNVIVNTVEVGTNVVTKDGMGYAHVLHFGATITPKTAKYLTFKVAGNFVKVKKVVIPPRPFLGIDAEDKSEILEIIKENFDV